MTEKKETKTTKKTTAKKVAPKKTAPKKTTAKKAPEKEVEVVEEVKQEKPKRAKRKVIDRNELIPCRSATVGTLVYISDRTRARFVWHDFGVVQYIEMGELLDMRASYPRFLNDVQFIVEDEEAVEALGLTHKYEHLDELDTLDTLFDKSASDLAEILPELPKGIQKSIGNRARQLIENGELDRLNVIRAIEEAYKIDLKMFTE